MGGSQSKTATIHPGGKKAGFTEYLSEQFTENFECSNKECRSVIKTHIIRELFECVQCSEKFCSHCSRKLQFCYEFLGDPAAPKYQQRYNGKRCCLKHFKEVTDDILQCYSKENSKTFLANSNTYLADEKQKKYFELNKTASSASSNRLEKLLESMKAAFDFVSDPHFKRSIVPVLAMAKAMLIDADRSGKSKTKKLQGRNIKGIFDKLSDTEMKATKDFAIAINYLSKVHKARYDSLEYICRPGDVGLVNIKCPVELLDDVGQYLGAMNWLYFVQYSLKFKSVFGKNSSKWYLQTITEPLGWTILYASTSAVELVTNKQHPAFAVCARDNGNGDKEFLVTIRGTAEAIDVFIDANQPIIKYSFEGLNGYAHIGILEGCVSIISFYGLKEVLLKYIKAGYKISVTGHSLGGGSTLLMAAEILNFLRSEKIPNAERCFKKVVAFAPPPVVSTNIADKMTELGWISVVHNCDVVPRASRTNVRRIIVESESFSSKAQKWLAEEIASKINLVSPIIQLKNASNLELPSSLLEKNTAHDDDDNDDGSDDVAGEDVLAPDTEALVQAGRVVYVYKNMGEYEASEITHLHHSLNSFKLTPDCVDEHWGAKYWASIRAARFAYGVGKVDDALAPPILVPIPAHAPSEIISLKNDMSTAIFCGVCKLDTTWTTSLKNESSRLDHTHMCEICMKWCCESCAPYFNPAWSADKQRQAKEICIIDNLPGVSLSRGVWRPRRICVHCWFKL